MDVRICDRLTQRRDSSKMWFGVTKRWHLDYNPGGWDGVLIPIIPINPGTHESRTEISRDEPIMGKGISVWVETRPDWEYGFAYGWPIGIGSTK